MLEKVSLGKLAAMPSVPIKSDMGSGIVMAPMKMESMRDQSTLDDIDAIIEQVGLLEGNLTILMNKTASEMGRSLADYYDYTASLQRAIAIGESYTMLANMVNLMSGIKDIVDIPSNVRESLDSIKGLSNDISNFKGLSALNKWYDNALKEFKKLMFNSSVDWVADNVNFNFIGTYPSPATILSAEYDGEGLIYLRCASEFLCFNTSRDAFVPAPPALRTADSGAVTLMDRFSDSGMAALDRDWIFPIG